MDSSKMKKRFAKMIGLTILGSATCGLLVTLIRGYDITFIEGQLLGTGAVVLNLLLLRIVLNQLLVKKGYIVAGLVHMTRLMIFGLLALYSFSLGEDALIGYGIGVLWIVPSIRIVFGRREKDD